jgi:hypothetical protein
MRLWQGYFHHRFCHLNMVIGCCNRLANALYGPPNRSRRRKKVLEEKIGGMDTTRSKIVVRNNQKKIHFNLSIGSDGCFRIFWH